MPAAPLPYNEEMRLAALRELKVLDTEAEPAFDAMTSIAASLLGTPIALISLVDADRQWFKARFGLDAAETPRSQAFCGYAILGDAPLAVENAAADDRFADNPLVAGAPDIRAYLGAPLKTRDGFALGTICAIDRKPVAWTAEQRDALARLSTVVVQMLEWRRSALDATAGAAALHDANVLLEQVSRIAGVGSWSFEPETRRLDWSAQTRRIHDAPEEYVPEVESAIEHYAPEARPIIAEAVERCIATGEPYDFEMPLETCAGRRIHVRSIGERVAEPGRPVRLIGTFQDVTLAHKREEALRRAEEDAEAARDRLWNALEAIPDGFVVYDAEDRLVAANRRYKEIYADSAPAIEVGASFEQILRFGLANGQYPEAAGREDEWLAERLALHRLPKRAIEQKLPNGRWLQIHESVCENGDLVGFRVDITESKRVQQRLQEYSEELEAANAAISQHALTDALTGLANRRAFSDGLDRIAARCERSGETLGVIVIDLDRFKPINDRLGHEAGDRVLAKTAERLKETVRADDLVARLGGDEFVVVGSMKDGAEIDRVARRIVDSVAAPIDLDGVCVAVGASVGAAVGAGAAIDAQAVLREADMALYDAKQTGRGRAVRFDADVGARRAAAR